MRVRICVLADEAQDDDSEDGIEDGIKDGMEYGSEVERADGIRKVVGTSEEAPPSNLTVGKVKFTSFDTCDEGGDDDGDDGTVGMMTSPSWNSNICACSIKFSRRSF